MQYAISMCGKKNRLELVERKSPSKSKLMRSFKTQKISANVHFHIALSRRCGKIQGERPYYVCTMRVIS